MKLASLVPSWTETLIACGADVVARTRFCIHPSESVRKILAVGGTKTVDWGKVKLVGAELLILDREENPKSFADESPVPYFASHIRSIQDLPRELDRMAELFSIDEPLVASRLQKLSERWQAVVGLAEQTKTRTRKWSEFPGIVQWIKAPGEGLDSVPKGNSEIVYVIWKGPWMAAAPQTFIGSMINSVGFGSYQRVADKPYPEFDLSELDPTRTVLLLSSEPYPFAKMKVSSEYPIAAFPRALIDGEAFSWFGLRSLEFLESLK